MKEGEKRRIRRGCCGKVEIKAGEYHGERTADTLWKKFEEKKIFSGHKKCRVPRLF
jgi:hypothetical protein